MMNFTSADVAIDCLLLDPNNYRFLDHPQFKRRNVKRFHDTSVQENTLHLLETHASYQLEQLKESIKSNGFVPIERIVVAQYEFKKGLYLVVDGNRRIAAIKSLLRDHEEGVETLSSELRKSISTIPCARLSVNSGSDAQHAQRVIMGIRHVAGSREWGAYQQAKLVVELVDTENADFSTVGERLGMTSIEVARRYRAMKALEAMEEDDEYGRLARADHYHLLHEFVSLTNVRERFGWDQNDAKFSNMDQAREFFELILSQDSDQEPKLKTRSDVRRLKDVIGRKAAEEALFDPGRSFVDVQRILAKTLATEAASEFAHDIQEFLERMKTISVEELMKLDAKSIKALKELQGTINSRLDQYNKLSK